MSMEQSKPIIHVKALRYVYPGGLEALRGVDLEIREGEKIGVIGQNGSGKTTLVKHFNGILRPTEGQVLIKGKDVRQYKRGELAMIVGYCFQVASHQIFCRSIREEIAYGPHNMGLGKEEIQSRVEEAMKTFGLEPYADVHPYRVGLGIRKLLTIASVYAMHPEVLVLDEPTTGQDYLGLCNIVKVVDAANKRGCTIVVISHDMRFVASTMDRVIIVSGGLIVKDDTVRRVFSDRDVLAKARLDPPQITQLAQTFQDKRIPKDLVNISEMYDALMSL
jgi:energy-coupling factor transporter ATP-binding protein EcfA2